jgi:hypothetical protein
VSEIEKAYRDIRAYGTATMMIIRSDEMPAIYQAAHNGNDDAQMRLAAVGNVLPEIDTGEHNCIFCSRPTTSPILAAVVFVSKKIERGQDALWALVCTECDDPDPEKLSQKVVKQLGFKRLLHDPGHG